MKLKFKGLFLAIAFLLAFSTVCSAIDADITILHVNDVHSRLVPTFNKTTGTICGGVTRQSGLINRLRSEIGTSSVLLLDAGDISQGTAYFSVFKGVANFKASKQIGFSATTMGNHEFDNGVPSTQEVLKECGNRMLCCNLVYEDTGKPVFQPYHVFVRNGVKIGVIGGFGDDAWSGIDIALKKGYKQLPYIETTRAYAKRIRPYVDIVAALTHNGVDEDKILGSKVGELDIIVGGHSHTELHKPVFVKNEKGVTGCVNPLNGTVIVQAGCHTKLVGRLDLQIRNSRLAGYEGKLIPTQPSDEKYASEEVVKTVKFYEDQLKEEMDKVIGYTKYGIPHITNNLGRNQPVAVGQYVAEGMRVYSNSDICISNTGGVKEGILKGEIKKGRIYEVSPYDNTVVKYTMKGSDLKDAFDFIAASYGQYEGFQYAGIKVVFNTLTGKAEQLTINGEPLDPERDYIVATTSFMSHGNDLGDKVFAKATNLVDTGVMVRDAVIGYSQQFKELPDFREPNYSFIR